MAGTDTDSQQRQRKSALPAGLGKPARRALIGAGYARLEQLTTLSEADLLKLHGVGPKGLEVLRRALEDRGLSFADVKERGDLL